MNQKNQKNRVSTKFELKSLKEDGTFSGYASVFGVEDWYGDIVAKGAFLNTIQELIGKKKSLPILWQHYSTEVLGVYLSLQEDQKGLLVEGKLVLEVQRAAEAYALLKAGAIDSMSIGYMPKKFEINTETQIRTLTEIDLWEISLVTFPANEEALVNEVKNFLGNETLPDERLFEKFLRDVGFSRRQAKTVIADGFRALTDQRDVDQQKQIALKESLQRLINVIGN